MSHSGPHKDRPSSEELLEIYAANEYRVDLTAQALGKPRSTVSEWIAKAKQGEMFRPDEWVTVGATINAAGGLSRRLKPVVEPIMPARVDGWKAPARRKVDKTKPVTWFIASDHHAPYQHKRLHELACTWLAENEPQYGLINGDLCDYSTVSKYLEKPEWVASVNECNDAGYGILRDYVNASPHTNWKMLPGNHEERLRKYLLTYAKSVYGVRPAETLTAWHSLTNLLRLDELGVELVSDDYATAHVKIAPKLAAVHGDTVKRGGGASARAMLDKRAYSIITGHVHRQGISLKTEWDLDGDEQTHLGMEIGCMCESRDGLGHAIEPDWARGFGIVTVWPDGIFSAQLASYVKGDLLIGGTRYT